MTPYEAFVWAECRSPLSWDELGEWRILGPYIVQDTIDKVTLIQ